MTADETVDATPKVQEPEVSFPKFDNDKTVLAEDFYGDWRDDFKKYGTAIIPSVITKEKADYYCNKQIEWLKSFDIGFDENDRSTWSQEHLPIAFKGGMYMSYGASHEAFVWDARVEPKVVDVFEKLWGTKELLCSFDGFNCTLPGRTDITWSPWPHCDQNPERKGMQAVQGLVNFGQCGDMDGGLVCMNGSSKLFDEFFAHKRESADHEDAPPPEIKYMDLFLFSKKDVAWFESKGCELIKFNLNPGDLILWDSRTMHMAQWPTGDNIRHAQYVCYTPYAWADEESLRLKAQCFNTFEGTTHWPHTNIRPTGAAPMRDGKPCPYNRSESREKPPRTQQILRYAGVEAY